LKIGKDKSEVIEGQQAVSPIAERISKKLWLIFEVSRNPATGARYNLTDVTSNANSKLSYAQLWKLYHGQIKNPGLEALSVISEFFDLEPNFWLISVEEAKAQLKSKLLAENIGEVEEDVRIIAARASNLPLEARQVVLALIDSIEKSGIIKHPTQKG